MTTVSTSIDVPRLADGIRFYSEAFGFEKTAEPYPGVVVLRLQDFELCLLEKPTGSSPCPNSEETRHYTRHWTPVHLDFHVDDLNRALETAISAGATQEQLYEGAAFCSDPFGHGFCLLARRPQ
jgi:catechol 2,3-dioxygenase-like lactoylglutathione lyase family enzyme